MQYTSAASPDFQSHESRFTRFRHPAHSVILFHLETQKGDIYLMQKAHFYKSHAFPLLIAGAMSFFPLMAHAATTGSLSGTVKSATGQPVPGAQVLIESTGEVARTDSGGNYNFTGEDPGTVTIIVSSAAFQSETLSATITQDLNQRLDFTLQRKTVRTVGSAILPTVPRTQVSTASVITADAEQKVKSQPNNLYQFPGLLFGQPGITYDPGGYLHIRGSDLFQVGFSVDGVSVIDPITNEFATNIVTVGLKSANFYTNVADPSYGGATGGFINEVTYNGRDLHNQGIKGITELTIGPSSKWNYIGTNTQFGDISKDGKFDYYASTIRFRNSFPAGFGVVKLPDSQDTLFKVNYYADSNNTVSAFYSHGLEDYEYGNRGALKIEQPNFNTNGNNISDYGVDSDVQHYDFGYVSLRHRFSPQSFLSYRYSSVYSVLTQHLENTNGTFRKQASTQETQQLDYQNQLSKKFQLKAGLQYQPSHNNYHVITGVLNGAYNNGVVPSSGYNDRANLINTAETDAYLGGEFKPNGDKLTLDLGARYAERGYRNIIRLNPFKDHYLDPRAGIAFSPNRDLSFHSSLTRTTEMPETRFIAYLEPGSPGDPFPSTATNPTKQLAREGNYTPNQLKPYYSENFDLGVDKGFKAFGSTFTTSLTGFSKKQYDLLTLQYSKIVGGVGKTPFQYQNTGRGQDTGAEFVFSKRARNDYDLNGFLSYTNSVTRATNSYFDTVYVPYFQNFVTDPNITQAQYLQLNRNEFSTSYDQRHTVAAVVSKKFNKFFGTSIVLDAGSGFPYNRGVAADGVISAAGGATVDGQHGEKAFGNASLSEVPVLLSNGSRLSPLSPVVGNTGWHYKISLNSDIFISRDTNLFINVDNVFDRLTATVLSTSDANGQVYYSSPTAAQPQGHIYYGRGVGSVTPTFLSFGFRHKF